VLCANLEGVTARPDPSFGEGGYLCPTGFRGRAIGNPALGGNTLYVGIGGGKGVNPEVLAVDKTTGETVTTIPLDAVFENLASPVGVDASDRGLFIAHPDGDNVLNMIREGEIAWLNEPGDLASDLDTDRRSFTYRVGVDRLGFSYVNTPGASARCSVLGPDGQALFRIILVILPGLRVSSAVPLIEGSASDGLYFLTRGGDRPYVFHVPYTVRAGKIVDEATVLTR